MAAKLLVEEAPLQLSPSLAKAFGVHEALFLQQLHYLLQNDDFGKMINGERWIYNTLEDWQQTYFPFLTMVTLKRLLHRLEYKELIQTCQPEGRASRRKYYRLSPANLHKINEGINLIPSKGSNCTFRKDQTDPLRTDQIDPMGRDQNDLFLSTKTSSKTSTKNTSKNTSERERGRKRPVALAISDSFLEGLKQEEDYRGIDIDAELRAARRKAESRERECDQSWFLTWLENVKTRSSKKPQDRTCPIPEHEMPEIWDPMAPENEMGNDFELFWKMCVKQGNRVSTEAAWKEMNCAPIARDIIRAMITARHSVECAGENAKYVKTPDKWIREKEWTVAYKVAKGARPLLEKDLAEAGFYDPGIWQEDHPGNTAPQTWANEDGFIRYGFELLAPPAYSRRKYREIEKEMYQDGYQLKDWKRILRESWRVDRETWKPPAGVDAWRWEPCSF